MLKTWPKVQVQTGQGEKSDHRKDMVILFNLSQCMICGSLFLPQSTSYKTSESFPKMLNDIRPGVGSEIVNVEDLAQGSGTSRPRRKERYGDFVYK
jgi:hypothetical protein